MKSNASLLGLFFSSWLIFQLLFGAGQHYQNNLNKERFIASIEKRVALDIPKLTLANKEFKTAADPLSIQSYLNDVNTTLLELKSPLQIVSLQGIQLNSLPDQEIVVRTLQTPDQKIVLEMQIIESEWVSSISLFAPFLAIFITLISYFSRKQKVAISIVEQAKETEVSPQKLSINLKNKSIIFGNAGEAVSLPNKPFCFYAALVDYCMQTDLPNLKHNNEVPEELLQMANKYFYRLIELGHTKRKRPDFGANLDKTLSEIRSALDDVFKDCIECKETFYPPKAQGEGSRSKMHNYAILNKDASRVEFIGK
jgi:hypothetical protein